MTAPFFGLDIATRALRTEQTLVDVTNQNIANANTPGYSRQTGDVKATPAYPIPVFSASGQPGQLGTGVAVSEITRARDTFLDGQIRQQMTSQGRWDARKAALSNVESIINEPSNIGLSSLMTKYFSAWQNVANSPSDPSARAALVEQGSALASGFNNTVSQLQQQQAGLDQQVGLTVANINNYTTQIANINKQIAQVVTSGMQPNDLKDQRDQLVDKLSSLVKISTVQNPDGELSIYVNSRQLVDRSTAYQMQAVAPAGQQFVQPEWSDGTIVNPGDGQLQGELESRDQLIAGEIQSVNTVAGRVISQVNALHQSGSDLNGKPGIPFFTGTNATNIAVNTTLTGANGTDYVAAARAYATGGAPAYASAAGDSSNAIAIANLANSAAQLDSTSQIQPGSAVGSSTVSAVSVAGSTAQSTYAFSWDAANNTLAVAVQPGGTPTDVTATIVSNGANQVMTIDGGQTGVRLTVQVPNGTTMNTALSSFVGQSVTTSANPSTVGDQYGQFVATLGVDSSTAQGQSQNQQVLVDHLQQQRESVSGVSLDEESTNLIQYQRAYQAAARVVNVVDSMLDTLINHTGVV